MILAITGMHRSGTSMVTNYLRECGVDVGDALHPGDHGNPLGYYEDEDFLKFHRDLMKELRLPLFPNTVGRLERMPGSARARARELVESRDNDSVWGWKDCRTTLFLEDWREVEPEIRFLFLFRHPVAVVDSLLRRGTDRIVKSNPIKAFRAWSVYNQRIFESHRRHPGKSFLIDIDVLLRSPAEAVSQVFRKFGIDLPTVDFGAVYSPGSFRETFPLSKWSSIVRHPVPGLRSVWLYGKLRRNADWR